MELPALCIRLSTGVLVLLVAQVHCSSFAQKTDEAFPRVVPDRLQFFEYDNFSIQCEGIDASAAWRVMMKLIKINPTNDSNRNPPEPWVPTVPPLEKDSGEYWCENGDGDKSSSLNISVTAGFVILDSPTRPVIEGTEVTLHCKNKKTASQQIADFYKDGSHLRTSYNSSSLRIQNVSKSDEGLYKCSFSGLRESPASWLTVVKGSTATLNSRNHPYHVFSFVENPPDHVVYANVQHSMKRRGGFTSPASILTVSSFKVSEFMLGGDDTRIRNIVVIQSLFTFSILCRLRGNSCCLSYG
ncbi:hypothetical protein Q5P01_000350 [Channa striata]|uniref:Ig-like domain-containing protein n=1 Tax=Channa striata TaxID=64152 RepID=A0AA88LMQ4_CHASR|nr:hypothetical protein Q5P01_000350 [Channa striata]